MIDRAKLEYTSPVAQYSFDPSQINFFKMSLGDTSDPDGEEIYRFCIEKGYVSLGWGGDTDYSPAQSRGEIAKLYNPNNDGSKSRYGVQAINIFKNWMKQDDLILVSNGNFKIRAIGRILGEYEFKSESPIDHHHLRKIEWLIKEDLCGSDVRQTGERHLQNAEGAGS
jgi:5-methylcytosine-specific restriction protein B